MMNKLLIAFILVAAFIFTACANNNGNQANSSNSGTASAVNDNNDATKATEAPAAASDSSTPKNADGFIFTYSSYDIYMDANMADVLAALGEARNVFEQPSCAFDGTDRVFDYPGIEIHTYPEGDQDFVHTVNFRDDSVTTAEGIYLGSSLDDMLAAYGKDYQEETGLYTYTKGQTYLSFLITDDIVKSVTYGFQL